MIRIEWTGLRYKTCPGLFMTSKLYCIKVNTRPTTSKIDAIHYNIKIM